LRERNYPERFYDRGFASIVLPHEDAELRELDRVIPKPSEVL
jgi:hypothetical protein